MVPYQQMWKQKCIFVFIMTSHSDENDTISKRTLALYARGNMLLSKFKHCTHDVK